MGVAEPKHSYEYVEGWGMTSGRHARVFRPRDVEEVQRCFALAREEGRSLTLRGTGCSYGDASAPTAGHVLDLTAMNRVLSIDSERAEADLEGGVTIEQLWKEVLPRGFWPKVVSGTMYPTVAGAAGMNIHGKNNFKVGTFGDNLLEIDLVLPSGELCTCNRESHADLFHAAIGGFGMLGCITRVKTRIQPIHSGEIEVRGISCHDLGEMMEVIDGLTDQADYLVGWIDCFAGGDSLGRGLIHHARYLPPGADPEPERTLRVDFQELPGTILGFPKGEVWRILRLFNNDWGMRLINALKHQAGRVEGHKGWYRQSHAGFNFLLDYVPNWKFAYGRVPGRGLIQYQMFVPAESAHQTFTTALELCRRRGYVSYLGVFKRHRPDPFWMTHALDGWSLALDFKVSPGGSEGLWKLCEELTRIVLDGGGRFYFAKDLVLGYQAMARAFPPERREAFLALKREVDPEGLLDSALFQRVFDERGGYSAPSPVCAVPRRA